MTGLLRGISGVTDLLAGLSGALRGPFSGVAALLCLSEVTDRLSSDSEACIGAVDSPGLSALPCVDG